MKKKTSEPQKIKVKLDQRTTVMINKISSLKIWKERFPFAKIVH